MPSRYKGRFWSWSNCLLELFKSVRLETPRSGDPPREDPCRGSVRWAQLHGWLLACDAAAEVPEDRRCRANSKREIGRCRRRFGRSFGSGCLVAGGRTGFVQRLTEFPIHLYAVGTTFVRPLTWSPLLDTLLGTRSSFADNFSSGVLELALGGVDRAAAAGLQSAREGFGHWCPVGVHAQPKFWCSYSV